MAVDFRVDTITNHMIHSSPSGSPANACRTPLDMISGNTAAGVSGGLHFDPCGGQGFSSRLAWRGRNLSDRADAGPCGNRYTTNVSALWIPAEPDGDAFNSAVVCCQGGSR